MQNLLDYICKKYDLVFQEKLELGCNSDTVCIATDRNGIKAVIKAAKTDNSIAEIKMNDAGYKMLREWGLSFFVPKIIAYEVTDKYAFMIMEYLGQNFLTQVKHSQNPLELYRALMSSMDRVYRTSLKAGTDGGRMVESFIDKTIGHYEQYVYPNVDNERQMSPSLKKIHLSIGASEISHYCFSNWDFTPEDVYLTSSGVRYSDPHDEIMGIPIIDMACFGGLVKLYGLPRGNEGYEEFRKFATGDVADILCIPKVQAEKIFYLGRLFQCFMSIRFRHEKNPEQAIAIFKEAKEVIERII